MPPGSPRLTLTAEQEAEVCRLRDEKYRSWEWTWGKTPAFTYEKSGAFHGAPIRVAYQAKRGIVSDAVIDCDAIDGALAAQLLNGARLDPEGFAAICLSGIYPELYSIYQAAKTISVGGDNIVIEDLAFSELVSDRAFRLILGALLLCRYGEVVLNLERKTEEIT